MTSAAITAQSNALRQIASDAPDYRHYRPLPTEPRTIRVLDIEGENTCTLRHIELDNNPEYHALLYYWGPPTITEPLVIKQVGGTDEYVVHVRRTVATFIKELYRRLGRITVWLDVFCINQRSYTEQSAQVAIMGDIYRQALSVYVWMGSWDPDLDYLCSVCCQNAPGDLLKTRGFASGMRRLYNLSYWTRVWIIQECILNDNLTLIGVDMLLAWQDLCRARIDVGAIRYQTHLQPQI